MLLRPFPTRRSLVSLPLLAVVLLDLPLRLRGPLLLSFLLVVLCLYLEGMLLKHGLGQRYKKPGW